MDISKDLDKLRSLCKKRDHSKGFCGKDCFTLYQDTRTDIYRSGEEIVRVTHIPTGIVHTHSTREDGQRMAKILCLDKIAEELRYLKNKYDRD